jgi:hypothetical protein
LVFVHDNSPSFTHTIIKNGSLNMPPAKGGASLAEYAPRTADFAPRTADFAPRTAEFAPRKTAKQRILQAV